jgi:large subunit ribosomal protein L19
MTKTYEIKIGDTVEIGQKSELDGKVRKQKFTGVLIGKKSSSNKQTIITVRRATQGFEVEKVFVQESPQIEYIKTIREAKVRRAKLYFLRGRLGKKARLKRRV